MLVAAKANAKTTSSVPNIIAGVIVNPVGNGERNSVEEHITLKILVCLRGHYHHSKVHRLPGGKNHNVPVAVVKVNVVEVVAKRAIRAAHLLWPSY